MRVDMLKTNPPIDNVRIDNFERERSIKLPTSYRTFLLATNGGVPLKNLAYPIAGMNFNPFGGLQVFFGLNTAVDYNLLEGIYDRYVDGIQKGIVPIADNGFGDYICLDTRNKAGRVRFWDKRHFWSTGEWREHDLYHVADNFEAFLSVLRKL